MLQFSFVSNDVVMTYDGDSGEQIIWVWESLNKFQTVCISRIFNFQLGTWETHRQPFRILMIMNIPLILARLIMNT